MPTWTELRTDFEATREALRSYRLDYQWGAAGTHYRLAGGGSSHSTRRFEVLASIAGAKLAELPRDAVDQIVLHADTPIEMWYEALRRHSGAFEAGFIALQTEAGEADGNIYTGSLSLPAEASAVLALRYSALPQGTVSSEQPATYLARVDRFLRSEAERRGYLWLFVAFVISVILAALAL